MPVFENSLIELVQAIDVKRKSHRLKGGCYKWWASVRYLRTNLEELIRFTEQIQTIKKSFDFNKEN